jgi:hypothetical protein
MTPTKVAESYAGLNWELAAAKAMQLDALFALPKVIEQFGNCKVNTEQRSVSDGTSYNNPVPGYFLVVTSDTELSEEHVLVVQEVLKAV